LRRRDDEEAVMAVLTITQACKALTHAIEKLPADDLAAVANELFMARSPRSPAGEKKAALQKQIIAHLKKGLEAEEVLDLWNVVFPRDRNVYFDDETGRLHVNEEVESVESAD
jgi:hypothetical protein